MALPIIGIDLGTTNCCAAWVTPAGEVRLIPYRGGEYTMPAVLALADNGKEVVGYDAKRQAQLNPTKTAIGSKRVIGLGMGDPVVEKMARYARFGIAEGDSGEASILLGEQRYGCDVVAGKFLSEIVAFASKHLGETIERAVVTVPAYFNDRQRQTVYEAGRLASLEIVRIINEPTAAALAYGARKSVHESIAVFDLGGGTFDVSVIEINDRVFKVKATGGDLFLGGLDFDEALVRYILSEFSATSDVDLESDPVAMQRIRDAAEQAKIDLSSRNEVPLNVPYAAMSPDGGPINIELILNREIVDSLCAPLIARTFETCLDVCEQAGLKPSALDQVVLVGGQTRMPLIANQIREIFEKDPSKMVHPDEAVAVGAALFGWSLQDHTELAIQLHDVLPMAIGIEAADGTFHRMFQRNAAVPNQHLARFTTHRDDQDDLVIKIVQGDSDRATENALLGEFSFSGIRPGPAGSVRVEVTFDVNSEGILSLVARDLDTQAEMHQTVQYGRA